MTGGREPAAPPPGRRWRAAAKSRAARSPRWATPLCRRRPRRRFASASPGGKPWKRRSCQRPVQGRQAGLSPPPRGARRRRERRAESEWATCCNGDEYAGIDSHAGDLRRARPEPDATAARAQRRPARGAGPIRQPACVRLSVPVAAQFRRRVRPRPRRRWRGCRRAHVTQPPRCAPRATNKAANFGGGPWGALTECSSRRRTLLLDPEQRGPFWDENCAGACSRLPAGRPTPTARPTPTSSCRRSGAQLVARLPVGRGQGRHGDEGLRLQEVVHRRAADAVPHPPRAVLRRGEGVRQADHGGPRAPHGRHAVARGDAAAAAASGKDCRRRPQGTLVQGDSLDGRTLGWRRSRFASTPNPMDLERGGGGGDLERAGVGRDLERRADRARPAGARARGLRRCRRSMRSCARCSRPTPGHRRRLDVDTLKLARGLCCGPAAPRRGARRRRGRRRRPRRPARRAAGGSAVARWRAQPRRRPLRRRADDAFGRRPRLRFFAALRAAPSAPPPPASSPPAAAAAAAPCAPCAPPSRRSPSPGVRASGRRRTPSSPGDLGAHAVLARAVVGGDLLGEVVPLELVQVLDVPQVVRVERGWPPPIGVLFRLDAMRFARRLSANSTQPEHDLLALPPPLRRRARTAVSSGARYTRSTSVVPRSASSAEARRLEVRRSSRSSRRRRFSCAAWKSSSAGARERARRGARLRRRAAAPRRRRCAAAAPLVAASASSMALACTRLWATRTSYRR